ncbi:hypothetical protein Ddye_010196 [Dipteronia dyeriana]|uniref:Uncharacterized protein n=1 Tax=Dipteronia dyeriana TaxID=168575 RepID=A0AAE0CN37_9ROSI|nr:hypothetical protein Ddye_010196 [Dipteronia dyeriana]
MLFRYEKLQDSCFKCGRLDLGLRECLEKGGERDVKSEDSLRLSVWLRASSPPKIFGYGRGRFSDRNRGRQKGNTGNNFFFHLTGGVQETDQRSPEVPSFGERKVQRQAIGEKGRWDS